ncbi:MAG: sarcosine oxidase subunit alpha family protein [Gammaproteobacteria bacterium]|nr:sarcosine oxidase subunit alpha family protein [Gammaproteobacteria bacterium]
MARQTNRLGSGGRIDRSRPLRFRFNGRDYGGYEGDTLASALLANGVRLVNRSFKLHRPRGIIGCGAEEPNAILQLGSGAGTLPNQRATQVSLYDGLEARSTRGWPSLRFDASSVNDLFGRVFSAGFYYKTFMFPQRWWDYYEAFIRRSAGLGVAPDRPDPDRYEHRNAHCDVLVVGAGPAGLMAALAAARSGARVILADQQREPGGSLVGSDLPIGGRPADEWIAAVVDELREFDDVRVLTHSIVFGYHDHNFVTIAQECGGDMRERLWRVRARQVVLAQGAFERPLAFCNNDRPGVMLASAVSAYIKRYAVCPGRRAVVFTNNDSAYQCALDLAHAGATVGALVDSRGSVSSELTDRVEAVGIPVLHGHIVTDVRGRLSVGGVRVARWNGDTDARADNSIDIRCDLLAVSGGWNPAVHLHSQAGGAIAWDERRHCFVPAESRQANRSAGSGNGRWSLADCLRDGRDAGVAAARSCGFDAAEPELPVVEERDETPLQPLWRVPAARDPDSCPKQFLDFQNDTCVADVRLAVREGYRNVEHVKRYTALGFGTDQGKLGNITGMAVLAETLGAPVASVGTTTFRPPFTPVSFGVCAGEGVGELYDPVRKTAIHEWHVSAGAAFENVGQWHRPWYFPRAGEDLNSAVARECLATRRSIGILDASTLGKIDVQGRDAVAFLERIYPHKVGRMAVGRCAYGLMLGEDGMVMDDGVMTRLGDRRYYLTTTTGGAARVLAWLESWLQTEWPDLEVYLTSLTDQLSTISVAGPNSRRLLEKLGCSIDLSREQFPFMSMRQADLAGLPVQLFRVSFSGELAFEINVDSAHALALWQTLMDAGREFEITPYGTETMHVLRAEKGFVIVGQDTDGSVTPIDLGLERMLAKDKDFLGKRSLARPDCVREGRKQLVGLLSADGRTVLREGAQLIEEPGAAHPVPMIGHVTSSYMSDCLGHPIALALVAGGRSRHGETIHASLGAGSIATVTIVPPVFYDPQNERQHD